MGIIGAKNVSGALIIFAFILLSILLIKPMWIVYFVKWVVRSVINSRIKARQRAAMKPIVYKNVSPVLPQEAAPPEKPLETGPASKKEEKTCC